MIQETSKIDPDLNPTASQEPQAYRLKHLSEIEAYLLDAKLKFVKDCQKR